MLVSEKLESELKLESSLALDELCFRRLYVLTFFFNSLP